MLTPSQVFPFLENPLWCVRVSAARYLSDASNTAPVTDADIWQIIEKSDAAEWPGLIRVLPNVRATETGLMKALRALNSWTNGSALLNLSEALLDVDRDLLLAKWEAVAPQVERYSRLRDDWRARRELAEMTADDLWAAFLATAEEQNDDKASEKKGLNRVAERLIEALARHPAAIAPRVMSLLQDESIMDWREVHGTDLIGRMQYHPGVDVLLDKLRVDGDYTLEAAARSLVQLGTTEVLRKIADRFGRENNTFRIYAAGALGNINHPAAEAVILTLLAPEKDFDTRTSLLGSLCDLCPATPETLELIRQCVLRGEYVRMIDRIDQRLAVVAHIVGYDFPEKEEWLEDAERQEQRMAKGLRHDNDFFTRKMWLHWMDGGDPFAEVREQWQDDSIEDDEPTETFVRDEPRIGRNDPCPCGSGKKYKKCCLQP
jgi:hypothetical protein